MPLFVIPTLGTSTTLPTKHGERYSHPKTKGQKVLDQRHIVQKAPTF